VSDQELLRDLVPERRRQIYDVRRVLEGICDADSVLELRRGWGAGIVTALARVDGRALGVIANSPPHLGGAIDAEGADKAARFMQLCDAFELPILFLCDTPGFMVGPAAERTATVRHFARMFVIGANLTVPTGTIVLRKGYGLGAQAMAGGGFTAPLFTVGWPTSEFGGMGLEGAVRLGMRRELEAIEDEDERERVFQATVAAAYDHGRGVNMAAYGEIDDVIDPADSRSWIATLFAKTDTSWQQRPGKKHSWVDAW
jgi:acetyl-CoA carboxylase carboxyltransferase component